MLKNRKLALAIAFALTLSLSPATAASKSPTPKTKITETKKTEAKKKAAAKKKPSKVSPSPSPKWPPAGFKTDPLGETQLYLKVPKAKELVGLLSAKSALASQVKLCTEFTCGAVLVAAELGCRWWQITGDVVGPVSTEDATLKTYGKITTSAKRSAAQQVVTILLVTTEPIGSGFIMTNISADCNQSEPIEPLPNTIYEGIIG